MSRVSDLYPPLLPNSDGTSGSFAINCNPTEAPSPHKAARTSEGYLVDGSVGSQLQSIALRRKAPLIGNGIWVALLQSIATTARGYKSAPHMDVILCSYPAVLLPMSSCLATTCYRPDASLEVAHVERVMRDCCFVVFGLLAPSTLAVSETREKEQFKRRYCPIHEPFDNRWLTFLQLIAKMIDTHGETPRIGGVVLLCKHKNSADYPRQLPAAEGRFLLSIALAHHRPCFLQSIAVR